MKAFIQFIRLAALLLPGIAAADSVTLPQDPGNPAFYLPSAPGGIAHFLGSETCGSCHDSTVGQCSYVNKTAACKPNGSPLAYIDKYDKDVSIREAWSATMMGNAARDPYWKAKVRKELSVHPEHAAELNDSCTRCHTPMANVDAHADAQTFTILDHSNPLSYGLLNPLNLRHDQAMDGVSCSVCHQITNNPALGTPEGGSGGFVIDTTLVGANRKMYGPYLDKDLFPGPMKSNKANNGALQSNPVYGTQISQSKLCSSCHEVRTPRLDGKGQIVSTSDPTTEFPEQMPFSEWSHSTYNLGTGAETQTCQQCHMRRTDGVYISTQPPDADGVGLSKLKKKDNFAIHEFVGGNKFMLDIFNNNKTALGVLSNNFAATMKATEDMLHSAGSIQLNGTPSGQRGGLDFSLKVSSGTGHKLPSGYPSRRVILHVKVANAAGKVVWESGKPDTATGRVAGADSDVNPGLVEPHYDVISNASEVQIYESVMSDAYNRVTHTLLNGYGYRKDNRLLPKGFNKATASSDIAVIGGALTDPNFVGGSDDIRYVIDKLPAGNYKVTAELLYQAVSYTALTDLLRGSGSTSGEVQSFRTMFNASKQKFQTIHSTTFNASVN